jgi:hypothetical protein
MKWFSRTDVAKIFFMTTMSLLCTSKVTGFQYGATDIALPGSATLLHTNAAYTYLDVLTHGQHSENLLTCSSPTSKKSGLINIKIFNLIRGIMRINILYPVLPMILVRNQIRHMLGGETGKITFGSINYNLGLGAKEFRFVFNISVQCAGADLKVIGIEFMTVCIVRRDAACF